MYILSVLVFFMIGASFVGITGAAKGQGLAGGAIVFFYGITSSILAFIVALIMAYYLNRYHIKIANRILLVLLAGFAVFVGYRVMIKERTKVQSKVIHKSFTKTVAAVDALSESTIPMEIGIVKLNYFDESVQYFYGQPSFEKTISEQVPMDSIVVEKGENGINISYAPPWLLPEYMKLDYDILLFKAISTTEEYVEIEVNKMNHQTAYVDKRKVILIYWPEFFMQVFSVELKDPKNNPVRIKPLTHASPMNTAYSFLKPVLVRNQWMKVELVNDAYEKVGLGWIRWNKDGELLIDYSLLS